MPGLAISIRRACGALNFEWSTYHYASRRADQAAVERRIREIGETRVGFGYRRVHVLLECRRSNGHAVRLAFPGRPCRSGNRVRVTRSVPLGLCQGRGAGLLAPWQADRQCLLLRRSTAASAPHRNPQLPKMQQPRTAGELKTEYNLGQGHSEHPEALG